MANVQGSGDLSVFTWDGNSLAALIKNVQYVANLEKADTSTIKRVGHRRQTVKKDMKISTSLMSTLASDSGLVASNLAISAFTIGGTSYLSYLRGGNLSGSYDVREVSGVADAFKWPQIFGKDYAGTVTLMIPLTGSPNVLRNLSAGIHDADLLDQDLVRVALSIVIDNTTITIPMSIKTLTIDLNEKQEQIVTLQLEGEDPGTGDFPTAPTGTTTLLEKFFNGYNTAIAMVLTTFAASDGVSYAGNFIPESFGLGFNDAEITMIDMAFQSRGAVTPTNN